MALFRLTFRIGINTVVPFSIRIDVIGLPFLSKFEQIMTDEGSIVDLRKANGMDDEEETRNHLS